jgi:dTDP-4-amino-4,6-dideoxygalactose transaminase
LKEYLASVKIPSMIYYPEPLHIQEAYQYLGYSDDEFPVTSMLCREVLSLPMHPDLEKEQLEYITFHILKFFENT